ncbi:MAG: hypothetical protein L0387_24340 [Acidobacteria bacterium]|nr:hypothetical protein [Acidobacteriota bacterium]
MKKTSQLDAFGQDDPTDNRGLGDWQSKYTDPLARRAIRVEAVYLAALLFVVPILMLVLWLGNPKGWLGIGEEQYGPVARYGLAWLAGVLGGTLFDLKWLYHSVARQRWHLDRRLWRLFVPHMSGGLAFVMVALVASGFVRIFDSRAVESPAAVVSIAFLVGYFSDRAIAKLTELAETLFGTSRAKERHLPKVSTAEQDEDAK